MDEATAKWAAERLKEALAAQAKHAEWSRTVLDGPLQSSDVYKRLEELRVQRAAAVTETAVVLVKMVLG